MAGASKLFTTIGTKGEGTLASKLGAALGGKAITESVSAEEKAAAAFTKLKEQGIPVYKSDIESLTKTAAENPKLGVDDLAARFEQETAPVPTVTSLPGEPYKGVATPLPVTVGGKEYPSTFEMEPAPRAPGTESLPPEYATPSTPEKEPSRLSKLKKPAAAAAGVGAIGYGASGYWGKDEQKEPAKVEDQKQTAVQPTPGPGGKTGQEAPPKSDDGIPAAPGQEKKPTKEADDIESILAESGRIQAALGAGKAVSRDKLESYLKELDDLKPVNPSSPDTQRFVQARAEAYRAYQEKADRNDWLEIAQNLVGAITNYASARSAMGTQFIGGAVPLKGVDYGARTERAGKEYAMELGQIGAEERAAETAVEREDRLRREELALKRGSLQEQIAAERERIREGEAATREAGREARGILKDILTNRRYDRANQARLAAETARLTAAGTKAATTELDNQIKSLTAEEKAVTDKLRAANNVLASNSKSYDKALAAYSTAAGVPESELQERAAKEKGFLTSSSSYVKEKIVAPHADELSNYQQRLQQQILDLRRARFGGQPVAGQQPARVSTTPAGGGNLVWRRGADGKEYEFDASTKQPTGRVR